MTKLLEDAMAEVRKLPEQEQDAVARQLLDELRSQAEWNRRFDASADKLRLFAAKAREEFFAGKTEPLDPDKL